MRVTAVRGPRLTVRALDGAPPAHTHIHTHTHIHHMGRSVCGHHNSNPSSDSRLLMLIASPALQLPRLERAHERRTDRLATATARIAGFPHGFPQRQRPRAPAWLSSLGLPHPSGESSSSRHPCPFQKRHERPLSDGHIHHPSAHVVLGLTISIRATRWRLPAVPAVAVVVGRVGGLLFRGICRRVLRQ